MKIYLLLLFGMITSFGIVNGQGLMKNGVSANFGFGISGSSHTIYTFSLGYQREVSKKLYLTINYTDTQGSQSFESLFGEKPKVNLDGQFGEAYQLRNAEFEDIFGRLIQIESWSLGIKKYIQLSPKTQMAANISVVTNGISRMDVKGLETDNSGNVNYENAYPAHGTYRKISGLVGFEFLFNVKDSINLVSRVDYLTFESITTLSLGTTVSF